MNADKSRWVVTSAWISIPIVATMTRSLGEKLKLALKPITRHRGRGTV